MSKPGACHQLSFATNPVLSNFIGKLPKFFLYNLTFQCQIIMESEFFENEINSGLNNYRTQLKLKCFQNSFKIM